MCEPGLSAESLCCRAEVRSVCDHRRAQANPRSWVELARALGKRRRWGRRGGRWLSQKSVKKAGAVEMVGAGREAGRVESRRGRWSPWCVCR